MLFCFAKMLVGLCPNPICSASCRCRRRVCSKHFYNKKDSLGFFHEGRILGYLHLSGLHFFGNALFLCKEHFYVSLCTKKLLHFFFRFAVVRVACFLFCQQLGIFRIQLLDLRQLLKPCFVKGSFRRLVQSDLLPMGFQKCFAVPGFPISVFCGQ